MNGDDSNHSHSPPPQRAASVESRAVLDERERAQFRVLVLKEAERVAELHRYKSLMSDRRTVRAQLSRIESELKEIEGRIPRHLLKTS